MPEPFKTKVKPKDGKISACIICNVVPKEGDDLWMQNIGTEDAKNWLVSPHEECFKKLQADPSLKNKKGSGQRQAKTPEQVVSYRVAMSEEAWKYAKDKAQKELPLPVLDPKHQNNDLEIQKFRNLTDATIKDRRILASVFYYGIMKGGS